MVMSQGAPTGRRFVFEDHRLTEAEHKALWIQRVREAEEALEIAITVPPKWDICEQVEVDPGDERYADAPIAEVWINIQDRTCQEKL